MSDMFDSLEAEMAGLRRELEAVKAERDGLASKVELWRKWMRRDPDEDVGEWIDDGWHIAKESPSLCINRLKATARAEAMEWAAEKAAPSVAPWLKALARDYRRQAGEDA